MDGAPQLDQFQRRGAEYTRKRQAIGFLAGVGIGLTPWLALQETITDKLRALALSAAHGIFALALLIEFFLIAVPLLLVLLITAWFQYRLNVRYGVSLQKPLSALSDIVKRFALQIGFLLVCVLIIYASNALFCSWWWAGAGTGIGLVWVVYIYLFPTVVLPLFFKMNLLEDRNLLASIRRLASYAGVKIEQVYTLQLSDKFNLSNMAVAGVGRHRALLLTDTILKECTEGEIEALLAHELGHVRYRDVEKRAAAMAFLSIVACWVASIGLSLLNTSLDDIGSLPTLWLFLMLPYCWGLLLIKRIWRKAEFRADEFAFKLIGDTAAFVSALRRISEKNLLQVTPKNQHRFAHPATEERIKRAQAFISSAPVCAAATSAND